MKTLIAIALAAAVASPVLAQASERTSHAGQASAQVSNSAPKLFRQSQVGNAYAAAGSNYSAAGNLSVTPGTDPDAFIRSQLPRDIISN